MSLFASLAVLWLLLSGHYVPLLLGLGLASCLLVVWLAARMRLTDAETQPLHLTWQLPVYWFWLLGQILLSNLDVAQRVLGRKPISPTLVELDATTKTELGQVIFANSITLTPGTVTVGLEDGHLRVHGLTAEAANELHRGEMDHRVHAMEERPEDTA